MKDKYERKIILFIDILGFKNLVFEEQERGPQFILNKILKHLSEDYHKDHLIKNFVATICPASQKQNPDLSYQSFQISDSFIATADPSPVGVVNLVNIARYIQLKTFNKGLLVRGAIHCGPVYHTPNQIFGPAYQEALTREKESLFKGFKGAPVIHVTNETSEIVKGDKCCLDMFGRLTNVDENEKIAVNPFVFIDSLLSSPDSISINAEVLNKKISEYLKWIDEGVLKVQINADIEDKEKKCILEKYTFIKNWLNNEKSKVESTVNLYSKLNQSGCDHKSND